MDSHGPSDRTDDQLESDLRFMDNQRKEAKDENLFMKNKFDRRYNSFDRKIWYHKTHIHWLRKTIRWNVIMKEFCNEQSIIKP